MPFPTYVDIFLRLKPVVRFVKVSTGKGRGGEHEVCRVTPDFGGACWRLCGCLKVATRSGRQSGRIDDFINFSSSAQTDSVKLELMILITVKIISYK
jgi:hypothetical protein